MSTFTWPLFVAPAVVPVSAVAEEISAIQALKRDMMLSTSEGTALTTIGQNYGVPRPPGLTDDEIYRRCVQVLAWQPKMILFTTEALLAAIFGSQSKLVSEGRRPWRVYEVNANEVIIEIPQALISMNNETASYLHGWDGYAYTATTGNTFTTEGDVRTASATTLVGQTLYAFVGGLWATYTINSVSYSATTNLSTIQVNIADIPAGGTLFFILPAGDNVVSFKGDYIAPSGHVATFWTDPGVGTTNTVKMWGDYSTELEQNHTVTLIYSGQPHTAVITNTPTYQNPAAFSTSPSDFTSFNVNILVPLGLTAGTLLKDVEAADTPTTATHADRVYFTGDGLYEVFDYYFNLLVRAAGIVVRLERI